MAQRLGCSRVWRCPFPATGWLQGQSLLPDASKAQIIFCSVPLWSALMAALVLPGEKDQIGLATWLGGGVIAAASLVAALPRRGRR